MITRVQAKNFKSFREIDVELGPLTVFVGRNASGKSNFVDILRFVRDALTRGLDAAITDRGGFEAIAHAGADGKSSTIEITLFVENGQMTGNYLLVLVQDNDSVYVERENTTVAVETSVQTANLNIVQGKIEYEGANSLLQQHQRFMDFDRTKLGLAAFTVFDALFDEIYQQLVDIDCFHLFPNTLRSPSQQITSARLVMDDLGSNMYAALRRLTQDAQRKNQILVPLSYVVEDVSDIGVEVFSSRLFGRIKHSNGEHRSGASKQQGSWFDLEHESDGTLRVLGMLVGLYQDQTGGRVLAFEEPELSVHIGALQMFYELFDEAALSRQIIVTTHSPDFIASCKVSELRIVERVNGESKIGRLLESQIEAINELLAKTSDLIRIQGFRREEEAEEIAHA